KGHVQAAVSLFDQRTDRVRHAPIHGEEPGRRGALVDLEGVGHVKQSFVTRTRPDPIRYFGRNLSWRCEERFQDEQPVHNNVAMNRKVFAGAFAVVAVCALVGPRFFAARPTGAGADPSPPNAPNQKPAFPGQTRAPVRTANVAFDVVTVAGGFENPWSV